MLDHIGAMLGVRRLGATFAETTLRFAIAAPVGFPVRIPAGTRATADSRLYFETAELSLLPAGESSIDVPARAMTAGAAANGLVPGQVSRLCDPLDVVITVANTTASAGGAEVEEDEPFRDRIRQAPEKFTSAGSEGAYIYWARTAHPSVADVSPDSPTPGDAHLYILLNGGIIPDPDGPEIKAVAAAVSEEKVRPLTDRTRVFPAVGVDIDYAFVYYLNRQQAGFADIIAENVKRAAAEYSAWQTMKIGRDVNPDELVRACRAAGAKRIAPVLIRREAAGTGEDGDQAFLEVEEPLLFRKLTRREAARIPPRADRVRFGGVEDD